MLTKFAVEQFIDELSTPVPVAVPLGEQVSKVQTRSLTIEDNSNTRMGVWRCSPGTWRRQIIQAEFCYFIDGECSFTPDGEEPIYVKRGDVLFFPPNSGGVWDVQKTSTKIYFIADRMAS